MEPTESQLEISPLLDRLLRRNARVRSLLLIPLAHLLHQAREALLKIGIDYTPAVAQPEPEPAPAPQPAPVQQPVSSPGQVPMSERPTQQDMAVVSPPPSQ